MRTALSRLRQRPGVVWRRGTHLRQAAPMQGEDERDDSDQGGTRRGWLTAPKATVLAAGLAAVAVVAAPLIGGIFKPDPAPQRPVTGGDTTPPSRTAIPGPHSAPTITPETGASIDSLSSGDSIVLKSNLSGRANPVARGDELWLLVEIPADRRFFPGEGAVTPRTNGTWRALLYVGGEGDSGRDYNIHLVLLHPAAAAEFASYQARERQTGKVVGFDSTEIAQLGIEFLDSVRVVRS